MTMAGRVLGLSDAAKVIAPAQSQLFGF
jgi:hypothetical protein